MRPQAPFGITDSRKGHVIGKKQLTNADVSCLELSVVDILIHCPVVASTSVQVTMSG